MCRLTPTYQILSPSLLLFLSILNRLFYIIRKQKRNGVRLITPSQSIGIALTSCEGVGGVGRLCGGDLQRPIRIKCEDWNRNSEPDFMGELETTVGDLVDLRGDRKGVAFRKRDKRTGQWKNKFKYGHLLVREAKISKRHSFTQFLMGGMQIELVVAVDFTGSNGRPSDPRCVSFFLLVCVSLS